MIHYQALMRRLTYSFCLLVFVQSHTGTAAVLTGVNVSDPVAGTTTVGLLLEQGLTQPKMFTSADAKQIILDLPGVRSAIPEHSRSPEGDNLVERISAIEAQGRTRAILHLSRAARPSVQTRNNSVVITLKTTSPLAMRTPARASAPIKLPSPQRLSSTRMPAVLPVKVPTPRVSTATPCCQGAQTKPLPLPSISSTPSKTLPHQLKAVRFRGGDSIGVAVLEVQLSDRHAALDIDERGDKIIISIDDTSLPKSLEKRLDVRDFSTPVQYVDSFQRGNKTIIEITPRHGWFDLSNYQSNELLTLEIAPRAQPQTSGNRTYDGKRISMNFQDIDVRAALQMIADFTNQNMVVSDSVSGGLTLRLKNVPWDQALDIILRTKSLAQRSNNGVIYVAPQTELSALERAELEAASDMDSLAPLRTQYFPINYAKSGDLAAILRNNNNGSVERRQGGVLSSRGTVSFDERTNTLIATDTIERLDALRDVIRRLDVPVRQVLIESRIVIASDDFERELGVRFGVTSIAESNGNNIFTGGNAETVRELAGGNTSDLGNLPSNFNINLPSSGKSGTIGLAIGSLPLGNLLELELSSMQAEGRGEVVSAPRVITTNQKPAVIKQGVEVPYLSRDDSGGSSVEFREATLGLEVTPQITPDGKIILDLTVKKDSVGTFYGDGANQVPSIDTREVSTQVLVADGETIVLGGIYEEFKTNEVDKVPFLSDLPIIGEVFQHKRRSNRKNELLVFVTPKLINPS